MKDKWIGMISAFMLGIILTIGILTVSAYNSPHHIMVIYVNEDGKAYAEKVTKP